MGQIMHGLGLTPNMSIISLNFCSLSMLLTWVAKYTQTKTSELHDANVCVVWTLDRHTLTFFRLFEQCERDNAIV